VVRPHHPARRSRFLHLPVERWLRGNAAHFIIVNARLHRFAICLPVGEAANHGRRAALSLHARRSTYAAANALPIASLSSTTSTGFVKWKSNPA
jgi:hypothetical protein